MSPHTYLQDSVPAVVALCLHTLTYMTKCTCGGSAVPHTLTYMTECACGGSAVFPTHLPTRQNVPAVLARCLRSPQHTFLRNKSVPLYPYTLTCKTECASDVGAVSLQADAQVGVGVRSSVKTLRVWNATV